MVPDRAGAQPASGQMVPFDQRPSWASEREVRSAHGACYRERPEIALNVPGERRLGPVATQPERRAGDLGRSHGRHIWESYRDHMRVLVVEDEPRMARLLCRGLEEEGYVVDVAGDGPEAVWQGTENDYDVVVLDVMLPGFDGFEVCQRLRAARRWAPILLLTARGEVSDRVRGLDAGADDYLVKPFSLAELGARLRALTRRAPPERPTILAVGDLRLDPATWQAWRGDIRLELSPKEFAMLEFFIRHPGEVLTRSVILDHIWDFAYDGQSNIVDQYVGYLRRKIDRPFGRDDLQTVRGVGYRLQPSGD
jgi:two-component system OmpR family response regulator